MEARRRRRRTVLVGVVVAVVAVATASVAGFGTPGAVGRGRPSRPGPVAITPDGAVLGVTTRAHTAWLGIPYAAPPVGERRWRAPVRPRPWQGVRDATTTAMPCAQMFAGRPVGGEDCLHLDVYRPIRRSAPLPVAVYLHGGSFVSGDSRDYDPTRLVDGGSLIVVVIDYRLGPFGFLALDGLDGAGASGGDFGLLDQQAALRWVRRSIGGFGGDPARVALFGQSAGAVSVCDQMASPSAVGLFDAAIVQSGPCEGPDVEHPTLPVAAGRGAEVAAALGCAAPSGESTVAAGRGAGSGDCLRSLSVEDVLGAPPEFPGGLLPFPWRPAVGGPVLPVQPAAAYQAGVAGLVPVLVGSNLDDGANFVPTRVTSAPAFARWVTEELGLSGPAVLARYPLAPDAPAPEVVATAARLLTDAGFACPALRTLQELASARPGAAWGYEFADRRIAPVGAFHSAELDYLFSRIFARGPLPPSTVGLARVMVAAWSAMLTTGRPPPSWPAATASATPMERLDLRGATEEAGFGLDHGCAFWAAEGGGR